MGVRKIGLSFGVIYDFEFVVLSRFFFCGDLYLLYVYLVINNRKLDILVINKCKFFFLDCFRFNLVFFSLLVCSFMVCFLGIMLYLR